MDYLYLMDRVTDLERATRVNDESIVLFYHFSLSFELELEQLVVEHKLSKQIREGKNND